MSNKVLEIETDKIKIPESAGIRKYLNISEAKPFFEPFEDSLLPIPPIKKLTEEYRRFVYDSGPYCKFITLTFGLRTSFQQNCKFVDSLFRRWNIKLFRTGYHKRKDWLTGFAFFEDHPMETSINSVHVHILIKPHVRFNDFTIDENINIFYSAAAEVLYEKRRVFFAEHLNIQNAYVGSKNKYLFKQIDDTCLFRFKSIGKNGLPDNEYAKKRWC